MGSQLQALVLVPYVLLDLLLVDDESLEGMMVLGEEEHSEMIMRCSEIWRDG